MSASMSVISKRRLALSVAALATMQQLAMAGGAYAATSANLSANATITAECFISDASLAFGTTGALGALTPVTATATASGTEPWNCTNGTTATLAAASDHVTLTGGLATTSLTASVSYLGVGSAGAFTSPKTVTGSGVAGSASIFGQLPIPTTTQADTYSGTVGLTVTFT